MIRVAVAALLAAGVLVLVGVAGGSLAALVGAVGAAMLALAALAVAVLRSRRSATDAIEGRDRSGDGDDPLPGQPSAADGGRSPSDPDDQD